MKSKTYLTITSVLTLFFCLLASSCGPEGKEPDSRQLKVSPAELVFARDAGSQTLTLTTNAPRWEAVVSGGDWLEVLPASGGAPGGEVTVKVRANDADARSAEICFSAPGYLSVKVPVRQENLSDIIAPGKNGLFSIPELPNADGPCTLYYREVKGGPFYGFSGELYAHIGLVDTEWAFVQAEWSQNTDKCRMTACEESNLWKLEIAPSIREWFGSGENPAPKIGVVIRSSDGKTQTKDLFVAVQDDRFSFEPDPVVKESLPAGVGKGINYNSDGSVTLVLRDLDKYNRSYDWCYVIGEFSQWKRQKEYAMKRDDSAGCWWYTFTDVEPGREYLFQYHLGNSTSSVKIQDPYTEIVYDGSNDKYISSSTYPDLTPYPSSTSGLVGAFCAGSPAYPWTDGDFRVNDEDDLLIYELHFRDFTQSGDIAGALGRLDYLEALGINAVELMPVQEFDGNDSWGYNPCSYFALDKAYGNRESYKQFVDECHARGIAVIVDVVYNQATGAHPYAKMYWDAENNRTAASNPYFNVTAPHPYSVFHDWNHEYSLTREMVKESLLYLIGEYHVDGFRFDLTKGFTNRNCTEADASSYDESRISILKDYNKAVKAVKPDAIVILEHFCETREEKALAEDGMKLWRNLNYAFSQSAKGYSSGSEFGGLLTGTSMPFGSLVGYMESHDEERTAFLAADQGVSGIKKDLGARMRREAAAAALFLTVPGPKMLWQFQELGYDESINVNGRTGRKPLHWEYYDVPERKALYDSYCLAGNFRKEHPEFFREDAAFKCDLASWSTFRTVSSVVSGKGFIVVANLDTKEVTSNLSFPAEGRWTSLTDKDDTHDQATVSLTLAPGEWRLYTNF